MIYVGIKLEGTALQRLGDFRRELPRALMRATVASGRALAEYTHEKKLNWPSTGPTMPRGLRHQTGRLGRSVNASALARPVDAAGLIFIQEWGAGVPYAYKHEYGGTYTENVRAYPRRIRRMTKRDARATLNTVRKHYGRARVWGSGRGAFEAMREMGREMGIAYVRAHKRTRTYAERHMFRDARREVGDQIARKAATLVMQELLINGRLIDGPEIRQGLLGFGVPGARPR